MPDEFDVVVVGGESVGGTSRRKGVRGGTERQLWWSPSWLVGSVRTGRACPAKRCFDLVRCWPQLEPSQSGKWSR